MRAGLLLVLIVLVPVALVLVLVVGDVGPITEPAAPAAVATTRPTTSSTTTTSTTAAPATSTTSTSMPRSHETAPTVASRRDQVIAAIRAGFARFGAAVEDQAVRVASCETGGTFNERAVNGPNVGVLQLNGLYHRARATRLGLTWAQVSTDATANATVGADLYDEQGWGPWACGWAAAA